MIKVLLILYFLGSVLIPLVNMLLNMDAESAQAVFLSPNFKKSIGNSLEASLLATVITLVLSYLLAVCIERTTIRLKGIISIILVLPMLVPSISHGMSLVVMFGNNGLITRLFDLKWNIYGLGGIILGSVMYAFPVAFLMFQDALRYQDCTPYQAAKVLGIPGWRQFTAITFPYLRKPLISVTLAVFTMIVTDYGVPLMVGGKFKTLPAVLYQEVIGQLHFGKGSVYGAILLVPAVIGFLFDFFNKDTGNASFVTGQMDRQKDPVRDGAAYLFCGIVSLITVLPIGVFLLLAFAKRYPVDLSFTLDNLQQAQRAGGGTYLLNSVTIALLAALIGVLLAFCTAYLATRMKTKTSKLLHLLAITSAAIPGVVLGLSYVLVFKKSCLYGTLEILVIVNVTHFFSSPYLMMYNCLSKLNENLEDVGLTMNISRLRMILDVIIPQCAFTLMEMFAYFFVNSMMTISAVAFLANTSNKPVALMINQFEAQMQLGSAAVVSLAILVVNLIVKGTIYLIKRRAYKGRL